MTTTLIRGFLVFVFMAGALRAAEPPIILLPKPRMTGGAPLLQTLKERKSVRDFKTDALPLQTLSDLLWAAFGVNRPEIDHRTAPSAMNSQELDIYVALAGGTYVYKAKENQLRPVSAEDIRSRTGGQAYVKDAPVALILVSDHARLTKAQPDQKDFYSAIDAGYISQNIYLFCASENLGSVVHELDRKSVAAALKLRPEQKIVIAQSVGIPK